MTIRLPKAAAALAVLLALAAPAIAQEASPSDWAHAEPEATIKRWSWLGGTIWIVPHANLPAVMTEADSKAVVQLIDQTVYSIDRYEHGYFWGTARAQLMPASTKTPAPPDSSPTCMRLVGSVTPEGTLNMSFTPVDDTGDRTTGVGFMRKKGGEWTMELQMTTGTTAQVTHWAYMEACPKRGPCSLPAIRGTAQRFLAACEKS